MLIKIAAAALCLPLIVSTASAQSSAVGIAPSAPQDRAAAASQSDAARRDGALLTHENEEKPKAGHSETSAGKSGK